MCIGVWNSLFSTSFVLLKKKNPNVQIERLVVEEENDIPSPNLKENFVLYRSVLEAWVVGKKRQRNRHRKGHLKSWLAWHVALESMKLEVWKGHLSRLVLFKKYALFNNKCLNRLFISYLFLCFKRFKVCLIYVFKYIFLIFK